MRVLILHNDFRVYWKGRLTYLKKFLNSKNVDFYAIELFGKGSPYIFDSYDNIEKWWTCIFPDASNKQVAIRDLEKALFAKLDEINPDVVIAGSIVFYSGALGIRWAKHNNKKFVMFDDAKPSQVKRNFFVRWVKNQIIKQVDGLWLPSEHYYSEYSNLDRNRTIFFSGYSTIDNQLFKFKNQREITHKVIICVARFVPIKNLNNLLKAWKLVESKVADYKLVIIGDGPEFEKLNLLSTQLGIKTILFLGAIPNSDIPTYFFNANAFILPSYSESWGLVVNEAMAAGLPVLLSNRINANESLLQEGINGFSFNPLSISDISDKILDYLNADEEVKKAMSENSLKIVNTMSYEVMGEELLKALPEIMNNSNDRPNFIARCIINFWDGKYNTASWDKL